MHFRRSCVSVCMYVLYPCVNVFATSANLVACVREFIRNYNLLPRIGYTGAESVENILTFNNSKSFISSFLFLKLFKIFKIEITAVYSPIH